MIVNCVQINEQLQLVPVPPEKTVEVSASEDTKVWLDLIDPSPAELEQWLDRLKIEDLARRLCIEARDRPGFYPLKSELFFVLPILIKNVDSNEVDYITFICRENLLFSMHRKVILDSKQKSVLELSDSWIPARSIAGLLSALLINMSLNYLSHSIRLRDAILDLEERMDRAPDKVGAEEIIDMRSRLIELGTVVSDQLPPLQAISKIRKPFFKIDEAEEYMNCALVNIQSVDSSLGWLDGRISAMRTGYDMHAQDQTNRRLNVLTILSAIFNPAVLMAGFWGMNFTNMPLLTESYGYFVAVSLMVLTGVFMFLFFRKGGWFD